MEAHADKGNMGRWGSDDGKKSREALSHVHERCEDDALQSQRISVLEWTEREGQQYDRLVEEFNTFKDNQASQSK